MKYVNQENDIAGITIAHSSALIFTEKKIVETPTEDEAVEYLIENGYSML